MEYRIGFHRTDQGSTIHWWDATCGSAECAVEIATSQRTFGRTAAERSSERARMLRELGRASLAYTDFYRLHPTDTNPFSISLAWVVQKRRVRHATL